MTKHFAYEGRVVLLVVVSAFGTIQVTPRMMQCPCEPHPICLCLSWSRAHQSLNATLPASQAGLDFPCESLSQKL